MRMFQEVFCEKIKDNRGTIPNQLTDEDKRRIAELRQRQKEDEEYRMYRLRQRDI